MEGVAMFNCNLQQAAQVWPQISGILSVPHTDDEYERSIVLLNELIDEVGEDESHPLASLMATVGSLIENYETQHIPEPTSDPIGTIAMLMEEHGLQPSDLTEFGSESTAKEILAGKRDITLRQIHAISSRFHVPPTVFV
jgi:HTH-type transcriptional regulator/antitoxin HigA